MRSLAGCKHNLNLIEAGVGAWGQGEAREGAGGCFGIHALRQAATSSTTTTTTSTSTWILF
jgi:hypothetical protein